MFLHDVLEEEVYIRQPPRYEDITKPHHVWKHDNAPATQHCTIVKRILRYVKGIANIGLKIKQSSSWLISAFSDADWVGC
jgi:hypothetical protein